MVQSIIPMWSPGSLKKYQLPTKLRCWLAGTNVLSVGKNLPLADERETSKTCSWCGKFQAMPLWKRTYRCPNEDCRFVMDREEERG